MITFALNCKFDMRKYKDIDNSYFLYLLVRKSPSKDFALENTRPFRATI